MTDTPETREAEIACRFCGDAIHREPDGNWAHEGGRWACRVAAEPIPTPSGS